MSDPETRPFVWCYFGLSWAWECDPCPDPDNPNGYDSDGNFDTASEANDASHAHIRDHHQGDPK